MHKKRLRKKIGKRYREDQTIIDILTPWGKPRSGVYRKTAEQCYRIKMGMPEIES